MSVSNIEPLIRYKGDGAQTVFPIPYRFLEPEHIRVEIGRSGVTLLLAYLADYTVNESNVVTKVPPAAGDTSAPPPCPDGGPGPKQPPARRGRSP